MQIDWRAISGPALIAATAAIAILGDRYFDGVPDPAPLFVGVIAVAVLLGGLGSGLFSAVFAVAGSVLLSVNRHDGFGPDAADLGQLMVLAVVAVGTAVGVELLRKKLTDAFASERARNACAARLSAALDRVDIGIVLLDSDTRAQFINRAFRDYFLLPDEKADSKPPFIALMYHGRDAGAYELPESELGDVIARRIAMVRAGDEARININLANGEVLRFSCTALPDGGRMLSYTPVTDLVRHTDDAATTEYYRGLRGGGERVFGHADAAE
jgi:PAS domain-containing protein